MDSYINRRLGVRRIVNGVGPATRLGGAIIETEVLEAMAEAARSYVLIEELQRAAGRVIARITQAEDGYVVSGASAALTMAAAACIAGLDPDRMDRLPETKGMPNEVLIPTSHRIPYDRALRTAGAQLVEVGFNRRTGTWEIEHALTKRTAALLLEGLGPLEATSLSEIVRVAHSHSVPVIVDAACAVPPASNLRAFTLAGCDLVAFSGGKAIAGPQSTGFLAGRADLILSVALQHQDMDVLPETWTRRDLIENGVIPRPPGQGLGRGFKVGKEEIAGLLVALERYAARDHELDRIRGQAVVEQIVAGLTQIPGVCARVSYPAWAGGDPLAELALDPPQAGIGAAEILRRLQESDPPIFLGEHLASKELLYVSPTNLLDGEEQLIVDRLCEVFGQAARLGSS